MFLQYLFVTALLCCLGSNKTRYYSLCLPQEVYTHKRKHQQMTAYKNVRREITEVKCAIFHGTQAKHHRHAHCWYP